MDEAFLENVPNLELMQGEVSRLVYSSDGIRPRITASKWTTACALNAPRHNHDGHLPRWPHPRRDKSYSGGRAGKCSADQLSRSFLELGLTTGRLKTGTPPRLDKRTINWDVLEEQPGDDPPSPFSYMTERIPLRQVPCHITYTNRDHPQDHPR